MPNVVVYIRERDAQTFRDARSMKDWVRETIATALSERDVRGTPSSSESGKGRAAATAAEPGRDDARQARGPSTGLASRSESDEVKPDWKTGKKK